MMTCLNPCYLIQYSGELFYIQIKLGFSLIKGVNQSLTTLTKDSRAALVQFEVKPYYAFTKGIQNVVRLFADHRIK